jgi:hypothetical protein
VASGGAYSIKLRFWYYVEFSKEVVVRTLKHMPNGNDGRLISINVLEYVIVIISYYAALTVIMTQNVTDDPHPILINEG